MSKEIKQWLKAIWVFVKWSIISIGSLIGLVVVSRYAPIMVGIIILIVIGSIVVVGIKDYLDNMDDEFSKVDKKVVILPKSKKKGTKKKKE